MIAPTVCYGYLYRPEGFKELQQPKVPPSYRNYTPRETPYISMATIPEPKGRIPIVKNPGLGTVGIKPEARMKLIRSSADRHQPHSINSRVTRALAEHGGYLSLVEAHALMPDLSPNSISSAFSWLKKTKKAEARLTSRPEALKYRGPKQAMEYRLV